MLVLLAVSVSLGLGRKLAANPPVHGSEFQALDCDFSYCEKSKIDSEPAKTLYNTF